MDHEYDPFAIDLSRLVKLNDAPIQHKLAPKIKKPKKQPLVIKKIKNDNSSPKEPITKQQHNHKSYTLHEPYKPPNYQPYQQQPPFGQYPTNNYYQPAQNLAQNLRPPYQSPLSYQPTPHQQQPPPHHPPQQQALQSDRSKILLKPTPPPQSTSSITSVITTTKKKNLTPTPKRRQPKSRPKKHPQKNSLNKNKDDNYINIDVSILSSRCEADGVDIYNDDHLTDMLGIMGHKVYKSLTKKSIQILRLSINLERQSDEDIAKKILEDHLNFISDRIIDIVIDSSQRMISKSMHDKIEYYDQLDIDEDEYLFKMCEHFKEERVVGVLRQLFIMAQIDVSSKDNFKKWIDNQKFKNYEDDIEDEDVEDDFLDEFYDFFVQQKEAQQPT